MPFDRESPLDELGIAAPVETSDVGDPDQRVPVEPCIELDRQQQPLALDVSTPYPDAFHGPMYAAGGGD